MPAKRKVTKTKKAATVKKIKKTPAKRKVAKRVATVKKVKKTRKAK